MKHYSSFLKVLCTAIYVCTSFSASSQITLEGTVTDEYDNPISGAEMIIGELPLFIRITTNESGYYNFPLDEEIMAGGHSMIVSAPGFTPRKVNLEENSDIILLKSSDPVEVDVRIRNHEYELISNAQIAATAADEIIDDLYYIETSVGESIQITAEGYQPYTVEYNGQPYLDIILYPENYDGPKVITLTGTITLLGVDEFTPVFIYNEPNRETHAWAWPNTHSYKLMVREDEELVFYADDNAYKNIPVQGRTKIDVTLTAEGYQEPTEDPERSLITITGSIYDWSGYNPIPGATVRIKGTTNGAVADINGRFSIKTQENSILIFSAEGYESQEREVFQSGNMEIVLNELEPTENPNIDDPTWEPDFVDIALLQGRVFSVLETDCNIPNWESVEAFFDITSDETFVLNFLGEEYETGFEFQLTEDNQFKLISCEDCIDLNGEGAFLNESEMSLTFWYGDGEACTIQLLTQ